MIFASGTPRSSASSTVVARTEPSAESSAARSAGERPSKASISAWAAARLALKEGLVIGGRASYMQYGDCVFSRRKPLYQLSAPIIVCWLPVARLRRRLCDSHLEAHKEFLPE